MLRLYIMKCMDPTLSNTSVQGLTAAGKTWLSNTSITGQTDINVTGTATTTIGNSGAMTVVAGTMNVTSLIATGNTSVQNVSCTSLTSTGNVGIGTTTPQYRLDISGDIKTTGAIRLHRNSTTGTIESDYQSVTDQRIYITPITQANNGNGKLEISTIYGLYNIPYGSEGNGYFDFRACTSTGGNGTSRMRILNNGNVGIGTTTPTYTLDVSGNVLVTGVTWPFKVIHQSDNGAQFYPRNILGNRGNISLGATFPTGTDLGARRVCDIFGGFSATGWGNEYMSFGVGNNSVGNDGQNATSEKMRITGAGNVGIGSINPAYTLDVAGDIRTTGVLRLNNGDTSATIQAYKTTTDHRVLIHPITELGNGNGSFEISNTYGVYNVPYDSNFTFRSTNASGGNGTTPILCIKNDGYVGIGISNHSTPLHVNTTSNLAYRTGISNTRWWSYDDTTRLNQTTYASTQTFGGTTPVPISIYSMGNIVCSQNYISSSDRRIKTNIIDVDDDRALRDLRLLKPKTYTYKDIISNGAKPVYGFIAQEVGEVITYAVSTYKDAIPNLYELGTFSTDILTLAFNTADLSRDASGALFTKLRIKTRDLKDEFVNILEVIDEHSIRVDKDLTEWGGQLDASGQVVPGDKIFVYGQEVNDFHNLNKDAIWTVATAALQEVDRQLQAEKQKVSVIETTLASTQATLASTQETLSSTQATLASTQETLAALVARVNALEQR